MTVTHCPICGVRLPTPQSLGSHQAGCGHPFCRCPEPDFDGVDECRRCHRVDLRAPRLVALAEQMP